MMNSVGKIIFDYVNDEIIMNTPSVP